METKNSALFPVDRLVSETLLLIWTGIKVANCGILGISKFSESRENHERPVKSFNKCVCLYIDI